MSTSSAVVLAEPVMDFHPFEAYLRARNLKLTRERKEILSIISRKEPHFDAEELYLELRGPGKRISRATVYRTLNLLVQCGLVQKNNLGSSHACYETIRGSHRHDHLICLRCARIFEFHRADLMALQATLCEERVFRPLYHSLQIFGLCADCVGKVDENFIRERVAQIHT